ncbi:MAG: hypothetical protein KF796_09350 [Ramlibacter sp.]|nr:hypothetical protein [Ramlibacter sp.]
MKHKKFSLKPTVVGLSASLGLSATLLVACGGGDGTSPTGSVEVAASASQSNPQIERAKAEIDKKVYTLSSSVGAFGEILRKDGYSFVQVSSLQEVPANAYTILYVAGDAAGLPLGLDASPLRSFKGVVVVDSNQITKAGAAAGATGVDPASAAGQPNEGESPAGKLYRTLMGDMSIPTPNTTAFMTSAVINTIVPLDVDASGRVNGFEAPDLAFVEPQVYAMTAKDVVNGKASKASVPSSTKNPDVETAKSLDVAANTDKVVDIITTQDGYRLVGRGYIWATRETGPAFLAARKFVNILVDSGSNDTGCMVNGTECGVYPTDKWQPIKSTSSTGTGTVTIKTVPHLYYAEARIRPWLQTLTWAPRASTWTSASTYNDDSYETTTSTGWSVGGSAGFSTAGSFSIGPSASYSKSTTVKKKTYVWNGYETNLHTTVNNQTEGRVSSGIQSVNMKVRGAIDTNQTLWKSNNDETQRLSMFNMFVNGAYCNNVKTDPETLSKDCWGTGTQKPLGDGSPRGRVSYVGWNPTLSTSMEIPTNYFESTSSTKVVVATIALGADRKQLQYDRVTDLNLCYEFRGYRLKGVTNKNCTIDNVVTPSSTNSSNQQFFTATTWNLPVSYFTNAN